jgi:phospholipid/cholesterol/gamma-HCH transport system substrate-binding protein
MKGRNQVTVGLFLTIALVIGIAGTIWLVRGGLRQGYPVYAEFGWGANLRVGQPVRLAGVQVGYVGDVQLRDNGTLHVVMQIQDGRRIPRNAKAVVQSVGIFGDAEIALPATPSPQSFAEGDTIPAGAAAPGIPEVTAKADSVATVAVRLSREAQTQFVDSGGLRDVRQTLAETSRLVAQLTRISAEQSRQLTLTQQQVRRTLAAVDSAKVDSTVSNLRATSANVTALTDSLRITTSRVNATLALLQTGQGTAGKLLTDSLLYRDVRSLVTRIDSLTADFQKRPRKYINLEIF